MKKLLFILWLVMCLNETHAWDLVAEKWFPLKIGNSWTYRSVRFTVITFSKRTIIDDTLINGKHYFVSYNLYNGNPSISFIRHDSLSSNLLYYIQGNGCPWNPQERVLDSLSSRKNDSCKCNNNKCTDTSFSNIFGSNRRTKEFSWWDGFEAGFRTRYSEGIGVTYSYNYGGTGGTTTNIIGAVIDGVLYGDTNLVGINQISSEIPKDFSLSQNYPNPFNPSTNFEFRIANSGFVKLTIFDALGREVEILINRELNPGTYQVDFDGSNLPSGVYYYKLEAGEFTQTKKMVLIK